MTRGARARARSRPTATLPAGYLQESEQPLASLIFLLPLMVLYEIGTRWYSPSDVYAFALLQQFFHLFGANGRYLPALAVVGILLAWHIARNDAWRVKPRTVGWMALESAAIGVPVLLLNVATHYYLPLAAARSGTLRGTLAISLGAGIYEELVFRLMGFTLLSFIFTDWLKVPRFYDVLLVVGISSILFSLYHYLGWEGFTWQTFVFRTLAGVYFGVVFLTRGFGVTAGSHAFYDILVALLRAWCGG